MAKVVEITFSFTCKRLLTGPSSLSEKSQTVHQTLEKLGGAAQHHEAPDARPRWVPRVCRDSKVKG